MCELIKNKSFVRSIFAIFFSEIKAKIVCVSLSTRDSKGSSWLTHWSFLNFSKKVISALKGALIFKDDFILLWFKISVSNLFFLLLSDNNCSLFVLLFNALLICKSANSRFPIVWLIL